MTSKEAVEITGGLSEPSKMPGFGYNLPACTCKIGSMLRSIPGSVCSKCYARKGRYPFPAVQACLQRRLEAISHPKWVEAMTLLIGNSGDEYFRWHDSGDLQSLKHLQDIVKIAKALPNVKFWLPTKEYNTVREFLRKETLPDNLTVRLSSYMISFASYPDGELAELPISSAGKSTEFKQALLCPGVEAGSCGDCRECWSRSCKHVHYPIH